MARVSLGPRISLFGHSASVASTTMTPSGFKETAKATRWSGIVPSPNEPMPTIPRAGSVRCVSENVIRHIAYGRPLRLINRFRVVVTPPQHEHDPDFIGGQNSISSSLSSVLKGTRESSLEFSTREKNRFQKLMAFVADYPNPFNTPVLSPIRSAVTPIRSSIAR